MSATINDVAKRAGTSKSTVSRFLNGKSVKKPTEEALRKAISDLNYYPNLNARRLVTNQTLIIGVVVDDISNAFYSGVLKGIGNVLGTRGYECIFYTWGPRRRSEADFLELWHANQVDGLIFISFRRREPEHVNLLRQSGVPVVIAGDAGGVSNISSVDVDNHYGAVEMVRYLNRLGHTNIAYIGGPESEGATQMRYLGYQQGLGEIGKEFDPSLIVTSDWSSQGGHAAMNKLLQRGGFTAVVASNDESAVGAIEAIREHGYKIPSDFSVAGFDDIPISSWLFPDLTTVRQPFYEIGREAAGVVLGLVEDGGAMVPRRTLLTPELVIRHSCAPI